MSITQLCIPAPSILKHRLAPVAHRHRRRCIPCDIVDCRLLFMPSRFGLRMPVVLYYRMVLYYRDNSRKSLSLMSCVELFEEHFELIIYRDIVQGHIRTRIQLICMFVNVRDCVRQLCFLSLQARSEKSIYLL